MKKYIAALAIFTFITTDAFSQSEPPFGMNELQAYSLFYENFRQGDYEMALQFGKWMLEKQPRQLEGHARFNLPTQFTRLITVYEELSKKESDPSERSALLNAAIAIYDQGFEIFSEEEIDYYRWHFDRGRFYQANQSQISGGMDLAYTDYEQAFELDAERLVNAGDGYYIKILLSHYVSQEERDRALAMIDSVEPIANADMQAHLDEVRNDLFSDPEERIVFLEERLENNPDDEAIIIELARMYEDMGRRDKALEYAEKMYEMDPNFQNTRRLADYAKADAQNEKAIGYLKEAFDLTDDDGQKRNLALEIAETYQNTGNLRSARQYARQASSLDRNWGAPYIRIANIYAGAVRQCTSGRQIERDDRTVYWLVLDYLDRARSADSSVANTVSREYRTYEPVLPSSEDKFFRGWETGDDFRIGANISDCYAWIDETTKVR